MICTVCTVCSVCNRGIIIHTVVPQYCSTTAVLQYLDDNDFICSQMDLLVQVSYGISLDYLLLILDRDRNDRILDREGKMADG